MGIHEEPLDVSRLRKDVVHAISQFHRHAFLSMLDRNNSIVNILSDLLNEAKKAQLQEVEWDK